MLKGNINPVEDISIDKKISLTWSWMQDSTALHGDGMLP